VNRPTPALDNPLPKLATRTSTLATFDVVRTVPETVSPECTVVSLIATDNIWGGASGGNRKIATCLGAAGAPGTVVSTGVAVDAGKAVAADRVLGDGAGAMPVVLLACGGGTDEAAGAAGEP
jgi:hypothetical protein